MGTCSRFAPIPQADSPPTSAVASHLVPTKVAGGAAEQEQRACLIVTLTSNATLLALDFPVTPKPIICLDAIHDLILQLATKSQHGLTPLNKLNAKLCSRIWGKVVPVKTASQASAEAVCNNHTFVGTLPLSVQIRNHTWSAWPSRGSQPCWQQAVYLRQALYGTRYASGNFRDIIS